MDSRKRFTGRAGDYARYRPGYPDAIVDTLEREGGLRPGGVVVDAGAGTGISSELFARRGYRVIGIEPNDEMRERARAHGLDCRPGTAEATGLGGESADLIACAQTFHWVRHEEAAREFLRVTKPGGLIAIFWNLRRTQGSMFLEGLERLLIEHSEDYRTRVSPATEGSMVDIGKVFAPRKVNERMFCHAQEFEWEGLVGRMRSASYVPLEGQPEHEAFFLGLQRLYDREQTAGLVRIDYDCRLYWLKR